MRILLIDDHQLFSAGLRALLSELTVDPDISTAGTVAQALHASGPFDLILLDLHLPDAQGFEGIRRVKLCHPASPIVIVSGEEDPLHIRECVNQGAMGFVPKASSAAELIAAIKLTLGGHSYLPRSSMTQQYLKPNASAAPSTPLPIHLSPRQREVLTKLIQGKPNKIIGQELGISDVTVKTHVIAVLSALGVSNRTEAVYRAVFLGALLH